MAVSNINANTLTLYVVIGLFVISMTGIIITFPYLGMVINRWKLFLMGRKGYTPVVIKHKNLRMTEIVVDTRKDTFSYNDQTYNIRKEAFHSFNRLQYCFYESGNPEPLMFDTDDEQNFYLKLPDGKLEQRRGKVVDSMIYNQTCSQFYYAGIAFANRNKNRIMMVLLIVAGIVIVSSIAIFWKTGQTANICRMAVYNASSFIQSANIVASGVPAGV